MSNLQVLHLRSSIDVAGAEKVILALMPELENSIFKNYLVCIANKKNLHLNFLEEAQKNGLEIITIKSKAPLDFRSIKDLKMLIRNKQISILHTHGFKEDVFGFLAAINENVIKISTTHGWTGQNLKVKFYEFIDRLILKFFDRVVVVSTNMRGKLLKQGFCQKKVVVINNGIKLNVALSQKKILSLIQELHIQNEEIIIGTVGRLSVEKGHRNLLKAFALIQNNIPLSRLIVVGDGEEKLGLLHLADKLGIKERVTFTGYKEEVLPYYQLFNLFVLPSLTEGIPLALLEALAMSKPVIASRVGGIPEIIESGKTGVLLEPGNSQLLAEAILDLINNKPKADLLGFNGRKMVEEKFTAAVMAKKYLKVYEELAER